MKRRLFAFMVLCGLYLAVLQPAVSHAAQSESRMYGELRSTMQAGSYPQVVTLADQLLKTYPLTLYKESVALMKGESLCRLGRFEESLAVLAPFSGKSSTAAYWSGRCWFELGQYTRAANYFQAAVSLIQPEDRDTDLLFQSALVYGAQSLSCLDRDAEAIQLLEYAFSNCTVTAELQRGLVLLYSLYSSNGEHEKLIHLYGKTAGIVDRFPVAVRESIILAAVKSYGATGTELDTRWNLCLSLLESDREETVLAALSHAYNLADRNEGYDVSTVLDTAEPFLKNKPQWRSELWLRLGRDACLEGNCETAQEYYSRAMTTADDDQKGLIILFSADCYRRQGDLTKTRETLKSGLLLETEYALPVTLTLVQQYLDEGNTADAEALADRLWQLYTRWPAHELASRALLYHAWLYAERGDWRTVYTELQPVFAEDSTVQPSAEMKMLYAQSLLKYQKPVSDETMKRVEKLFREAVAALNETSERTAARKNLATLFLMQNRYSSAYATARTDSGLEYIAGLGAVGTGDWSSAANLLGVDTVWGLYYTAYANYQSGNTREAQKFFTRFVKENPDHVQARSAWLFIAYSAVQNNDHAAALQAAEKCYQLSVNDTQKTESALLWAELYAADHKYDKAIALLEPLAKQRTKNAVSIRFSLADLYSAKGDDASAAHLLLDTQSAYFDETVREESLYRLAELYFRLGRYTEAASRFDACRKTYPSGTHAQQALYYNALCLDRTGDRESKESAVLLYTMVTQAGRDTPFLFASWARLAVLNRELGAYALSLEAIEQAVRLSPKEAASLGLGDLKKQVQLLQNGEEEQVVALVSEYELNQKENTEKGRSIGVQLAKSYLAGASTRNQGVETLKKITAAIPENSLSAADRKTAAEAWSLLGTWQRQELLLVDSVDSFITSAAFWAGLNTGHQQEALYNAMKSLAELGRMADCRNVLKKMKEIDASGTWVSQAESLLEEYLEY